MVDAAVETELTGAVRNENRCAEVPRAGCSRELGKGAVAAAEVKIVVATEAAVTARCAAAQAAPVDTFRAT